MQGEHRGDHEGRSVLVTGGAGAIGSTAARHYLERGARVLLADKDEAALDAITGRLERFGEVVTHAGDLGDENVARAAVDRAVERFGRLDVVFNNAGIAGAVAPVHELATADWDEIVRANLRSMFLVLKHAARAMIASGHGEGRGGAIVNMGSSMSGWDVLAGGAGYGASKHAVVGLTRVAALDLARYGIRVNAVCPGVVETSLGVPAAPAPIARAGEDASLAAGSAVQRFAERIPLGRVGQPDDIAEVVLFLGSAAARHVNGAAWLVDGGQTLQSVSNAPPGDRYPIASDRDSC